MKKYTGDHTREIAFPLSGIGTGGVSISGTGQLIDWELDGKAHKGACNEYSHFAIKAERGGKVIDARILHGDLTTGLGGSALAAHHHSWGYGQGPNRTTLAGLAHFPDVSFTGAFPFASLKYECDKMPADISLEAFNPFIPGDAANSALPAAFFDWKLTNTSDETTDYTIAFSVGNPIRISEGGFSEYRRENGVSSITLKSRRLTPEDRSYGELSIATANEDVSFQEYWFRSGWFDDVTTFWREFSAPGKLRNRRYDDDDRRGQLDSGDMCTLAAKISLLPGETKTVGFLMTWYFPWYVKTWDEKKPAWKHEYARRFASAAEVTAYCLKNRETLYERSALFRDALDSMTLPGAAGEAAADNLSVLKSVTCTLLEDGTFWAFEGTNADSGSCEGTCDHVWGYQYALPFLFPELEKSVLETDYTYDIFEDNGEMMFRTMLPPGSSKWDFRACVDGQMGCVVRVYRLWKLTGDTAWLRKMWDRVKLSLEYAWNPGNRDKWDPRQTGVITGRQHHTLDVELFGANAWLTGMYLAALKAGAEMAEALGEADKAAQYRGIFEKGRKTVDKELFNGRHYIQKIDLKDRTVLDAFAENDPGVYYYWNDETGELKYQTGSGCEIDQLLGQWHASMSGLGDIFDETNRKTALRTMYAQNFRSMRDVFNPCRIFAANDEKGLLICEWAEDEYKPCIPVPYTEECMSGFEYSAAGLMIREGLVEEGTAIVNAIRDRYDGKKRNPYSEIECGAFYARSMASFALPAAYAGFRFDMVKKELGFDPVVQTLPFRSFWSVAPAWGTVEITGETLTLRVLGGALPLTSLLLPSVFGNAALLSVTSDGKPVHAELLPGKLSFEDGITVADALTLCFSGNGKT